jgi:hypothetical protein
MISSYVELIFVMYGHEKGPFAVVRTYPHVPESQLFFRNLVRKRAAKLFFVCYAMNLAGRTYQASGRPSEDLQHWLIEFYLAW